MKNNISIKDSKECSSCSICKNICPTNAIEIKRNMEGFYKPIVDEEKCISCGLCKKVCYKFFESKIGEYNIEDSKVYAMWSKDKDNRFKSSSGGIASEILIQAIKDNYLIIGAVYNNKTNKVEHIITDKEDDLKKIRGSKYLHSNISNIISKIDFNKKYVIVSLPCQIYGISQYLEKKRCRENFILIDICCHGIPSYNLWDKYLNYLKGKGINSIDNINFRFKEPEWHKYSVSISDNFNDITYREVSYKDLFMKSYLSKACINEACYICKLRFNKLYSDIRLGDFWGEKYKNNKEGISIVLTQSNKGEEMMSKISSKLEIEKKDFNDLKESQYSGEVLKKHKNKDKFEKGLLTNKELDFLVKKYLDDNILRKLKWKLKKSLKKK